MPTNMTSAQNQGFWNFFVAPSAPVPSTSYAIFDRSEEIVPKNSVPATGPVLARPIEPPAPPSQESLPAARRAAANLDRTEAPTPLGVELIGQDLGELCPFEIGARARAALVDAHSDLDRRRFLASLEAPLTTLEGLRASLDERLAG